MQRGGMKAEEMLGSASDVGRGLSLAESLYIEHRYKRPGYDMLCPSKSGKFH